MARFRVPFFRIFYSTTYTSLYIFQFILLAITPASLIYSSIEASAPQYIFIVGGVYVLAALTALFLYTTRLFSNRTVLAAVGKTWLPIEPGELPHRTRRLIVAQLARSAAVALDCRPRNLAPWRRANLPLGTVAPLKDPTAPPWGHIAHPGHTSPDPADTALAPGVRFADIVAELPHLLEARIVSLGGDPLAIPGLAAQGVRAYLETNAELLAVPDCAGEFLARYERARFGGRPLGEDEFIALTASFAEVLAGLGGAETPRGRGEELGLSRMTSEASLRSARSVVAMAGGGR